MAVVLPTMMTLAWTAPSWTAVRIARVPPPPAMTETGAARAFLQDAAVRICCSSGAAAGTWALISVGVDPVSASSVVGLAAGVVVGLQPGVATLPHVLEAALVLAAVGLMVIAAGRLRHNCRCAGGVQPTNERLRFLWHCRERRGHRGRRPIVPDDGGEGGQAARRGDW